MRGEKFFNAAISLQNFLGHLGGIVLEHDGVTLVLVVEIPIYATLSIAGQLHAGEEKPALRDNKTFV